MARPRASTLSSRQQLLTRLKTALQGQASQWEPPLLALAARSYHKTQPKSGGVKALICVTMSLYWCGP